MQQKLEAMRQKRNSFFQEIKFLIKGMDMGENIMRVVKITGIVGLSLLVIMLTGKTIQYVTKERPAASEKTQITKETEKIHANPSLEEQYGKLFKRVEKLTREKNEENEQESDGNVNGIDGKDGLNGEAGRDGKDGLNGETGRDGKDGLNGEAGRDGKNGLNGGAGRDGKDGFNGKDGLNGSDGKSAYTQAVEAGYAGTEEEFVRTISTAESRIQVVETGLQSTSDAITATNNHLNDTNDMLNNHINEMQQTIGTMHENFQNGCNIISAAITAKGVDTPANSTPNTMADNIGKLAEIKYKQGYVDGAASVGAAGVEYEYHYHEGNEQNGGACFTEAEYHTHDPQSCYGICSNKVMDYIRDYHAGNGDHKYVYRCSVCSYEYSTYGSSGDKYSRMHVSIVPICGKSENQLLKYKCTCGMSDGQIISAKITY